MVKSLGNYFFCLFSTSKTAIFSKKAPFFSIDDSGKRSLCELKDLYYTSSTISVPGSSIKYYMYLFLKCILIKKSQSQT